MVVPPPLDIVRIIQGVLGILKVPINLYKDHKELGREMKNGLEGLISSLDFHMNDPKKEDWTSYFELRLTELVYDIEDFAQGLFILRASDYILSAVGMSPRRKHVNRIKFFQEEIKKLETQKKKSPESKSEQGGGSDPASSSAAGEYTPENQLVGISEPKKVLLDLLQKSASSEQAGGGQDDEQPPKVISIVGCPGVGKTALARVVYDHACTSDEFECVAWVEASGCNDKTALLGKIREEVQADLARRASAFDGTAGALRGILADKRYLVFIDDVQQAEVWDATVHYFPKNGKSSMLIVTTSVHLVVNVCSSRPGSYVYTMQFLDQTKSRDLFWRHVYPYGNKAVPSLTNDELSLLNKCDGLPLALISVAKYLRITEGEDLEPDDLIRVGEELGRHLVGGEAAGFRELRTALRQCYESLRDYEHKTYMLSLSIFPSDHPIKSKSLVRRLVAEGLVAGDDKKCLDELIDRCIVKPVEISSLSNDIKSFQVNGRIMLEFIIHKSQSTNLVTLIRREEDVRKKQRKVRRLSVPSRAENSFQDFATKNELSGIRSLTIFSGNLSVLSKKASKLFKKKDFKFLRLLDLEGCKGLNDEVYFRGICELVYLKYLSLRNTDVKKIPGKIKKLRCLRTLDIRGTQEMIKLPNKVITLPKLAFLCGKFVLPEMSKKTKEFLEGKSELHTLGEIVVKKGFEHIILKARNLKKVKVRCKDTSALPNTTRDFVSSLRSRFTSLDSVSIRSSQLSSDILASLQGPCTISRMKLKGEFDRQAYLDTISKLTISKLNNLSKLQLSCTGLTSEDLSILQHISCLKYLKLQEDQEDSWVGSFVVGADGFENLWRLCFQASKLPTLKFQTESMKSLTSLHLLCGDISQMQVAEEISKSIEHITSLNEVILHSSTRDHIVKAWETAAKNNANRPRVKLQE